MNAAIWALTTINNYYDHDVDRVLKFPPATESRSSFMARGKRCHIGSVTALRSLARALADKIMI